MPSFMVEDEEKRISRPSFVSKRRTKSDIEMSGIWKKIKFLDPKLAKCLHYWLSL